MINLDVISAGHGTRHEAEKDMWGIKDMSHVRDLASRENNTDVVESGHMFLRPAIFVFDDHPLFFFTV